MCFGNMSEKSFGFTKSLDAIIVALCRDYDRRRESVARGSCTQRVAMEYKYLNYRMKEAACEVAGERYGLTYINEIGKRIGYAGTRVECVSESVYKIEKLEVKLAIARRLALLD